MKRLGVIVPSSNTVLEPVMTKLLRPYNGVAMHVARLRVTRISEDPDANGQFALSHFLDAARLLADAGVDLILWSGTAGSWLGFDGDETLVAAIQSELATPATTAVLAINATLKRMGARRIGLVTPYVAAVEAGIVANYRAAGIDVVARARCDLTENAAFARVPAGILERMIRETAEAAPDGVVVMCTNLDGAALAERLSIELGVPVIDSVRESTLDSLERLGQQVPR